MQEADCLNKLEYPVKMSRLRMNGKEINDPVFLFIITFLPQAVGAVLMAMFLTRYLPIFPGSFIAFLVFYNFGLIAFVMTISHPILRMLGRRGFIQREDQKAEFSSDAVAANTGRTLIKLTTEGALGRK
jgi:hypothetical protein